MYSEVTSVANKPSCYSYILHTDTYYERVEVGESHCRHPRSSENGCGVTLAQVVFIVAHVVVSRLYPFLICELTHPIRLSSSGDGRPSAPFGLGL